MREREATIQTTNHANLKRYPKSLVAAKKKKKSHATPPVCYLSSVYKGRGHGRGRIPVAENLIYLIYKAVHPAALTTEVALIPLFLAVDPHRGAQGQDRSAGRDRHIVSLKSSPSPDCPPHLHLGLHTYCGAAVHGGHLPP